MKKIVLSASIICADFLNLKKTLLELKSANIDAIHFDVMDGLYVPRFGLFPEVLTSIKSIINVPIDVHLMIKNPALYLNVFAQAGVATITVHPETTQHLHKTIMDVKKLNVKAGIALNPDTPLSALDWIMGDIDFILVMGINPGIVGHKLIHGTIQKISAVRKVVKDFKKIVIGVDGGVTFESAQHMVDAGADFLVCGSSTIFKQDNDISSLVKKLRKSLTLV